MAAEELDELLSVLGDSISAQSRLQPEVRRYLTELSGYSAEQLVHEPSRLRAELNEIQEQTRELAFHNYSTFIHTAQASRDIFKDFQIIESRAEELQEKLPEFSEKCKAFLKNAQEISNNRKRNTWTLQKHPQLLELLELPQLMNTCVRSSCYEEALELAAHVRRLQKRHSNIPVIASLVGEVQQTHELMLSALLQELHTSLQLPACLRVVGFLRRIEAFSEPQLRLKFLQARDAWFQGLIDAVPKDDPYNHIIKVIDISRVNLFDIVTQYRAIFSDDDSFLTSRDDETHQAAIFQSWVTLKVEAFLSLLQADLGRGGQAIAGRLDSVLARCMYFGLSFSRVGVDFRGLLAPIFQTTVLDFFSQAVDEALSSFSSAMKSYSPHVSGAAFSSPLDAQELSPPSKLLDFPPLAQFCNSVLTAINQLRLCCSLSLVQGIREALQRVLCEAASAIAKLHSFANGQWTTAEADAFSAFVACFCSQLTPYMCRVHAAMFPAEQLMEALGLLPHAAKPHDCDWELKAEACNAPLRHLISTNTEPTPEVPTSKYSEKLGANAPAVLSSASAVDATSDALTGDQPVTVNVQSPGAASEDTAASAAVGFTLGSESDAGSGVSEEPPATEKTVT